jgi:nucleoside-diphosphate kinase
MSQYTFTIIKPDAFGKGFVDPILQRIAFEGFKTIGMKFVHMNVDQATEFYSVHKDKPFYNDLISFMTSGPCCCCALQKANAVDDYRKLIGETDPKECAVGTIRGMYGESVSSNAVHGADSNENAIKEISFFFPELTDKITRIQ